MKPLAEGRDSVEIEAATIGELLRKLVEAHPGLAPVAEAGIAVSIDSVLYQNSHQQPIPEGSEVYLLPRLKGG
jgi:molybdopterin converting factor small subunit